MALKATGGAVLLESIAGDGVAVSLGRAACAFPSDADFTPAASIYAKRQLDITGTLTAGRNLILPLVDGAEFVIINGTGQAVTVKGATGSGIAVATAKTAIVRCNGTNYYRVTADV
jgi:hypothetical protein